MDGLQDIPIHLEGPSVSDPSTNNLLPILHQVRHALELLINRGKTTTIDLSAIPFASGDEEQLRATLGAGEVVATIDALGETTVLETAYAGVWLVEHFSPERVRIALHLEVAKVPFLLKAQNEDLVDARIRLGKYLDGLTDIDPNLSA